MTTTLQMPGYPVALPITVQWGDMDALQHVNNTRYFRWFETARIATFQAMGLVAEGQPRVGPILAATECRFIRPVSWPAELVVGARIDGVGNTSFTMGYAVAHVAALDTPVAVGTGVVVLIDYRTGEKVRVPDEMRAAIAAL